MTRRIYLVRSKPDDPVRSSVRVFLANGQQIRGVSSIEWKREHLGEPGLVTLRLTETKVIATTKPPKRRIASRSKP